jgi:hypothetical protein
VTPPPPPTLGYAANISPIIRSFGCSGCHPNAGSLTVSYATLVNVSAVELPSIDYVTPGDPGHSYFWCKVNPTDAACAAAGTAISGSRMPLGGPYIDATNLATIETWIMQGANP